MNPNTHELSSLLLPEVKAEPNKTGRFLERVPEGKNDFRPHPKWKRLID
jgi:hypothetical protein